LRRQISEGDGGDGALNAASRPHGCAPGFPWSKKHSLPVTALIANGELAHRSAWALFIPLGRHYLGNPKTVHSRLRKRREGPHLFLSRLRLNSLLESR
jgi:hypothetical protein